MDALVTTTGSTFILVVLSMAVGALLHACFTD